MQRQQTIVENDENHWIAHDSMLNNLGNIDSSKIVILFKQKFISILFLFIEKRHKYFTILSNILASECCRATVLRDNRLVVGRW